MLSILFQVLWLSARHVLPAGALSVLATALGLVCGCPLSGAGDGP